MTTGEYPTPETFVRSAVAAIDEAQAAGAHDPADIAAALNARGFTTRKGRAWTGAIVAKFLASPGVKRIRSS